MRALLAALATVVPWIPAAPPPTPTPPLAAPCTAANLRMTSSYPAGATGWWVGGVTVRNVGAPCALTGRPTIVVSPHVRVLEVGLAVDHLASQQLQPDALPPTYSLRAIPTGAYVFFGYWWTNWCHRATPSFVVRFPDGSSKALPPNASIAPRCDDEASPPARTVAEIEVGRFIQWSPPPARRTHLPFTIKFTRPVYRATAGSFVRFTVTIRNASKQSYTFRRCPAYQESLVNGKLLSEEHILNCRGVRTFAPGESRVFAMRMRVPRGYAGTRATLDVELGLGTRDPVATGLHWAQVTIS